MAAWPPKPKPEKPEPSPTARCVFFDHSGEVVCNVWCRREPVDGGWNVSFVYHYDHIQPAPGWTVEMANERYEIMDVDGTRMLIEPVKV